MIPLTWTEDRATQRCDPSAVPGAKTRGGAGLRLAPLPSSLRDWHQSDKPSRQDAATVLQDAPFNPLACMTELPFHAEPRHSCVGHEHILTIEVDPGTRTIVQAKGKRDSYPSPEGRNVMLRWVRQEGLKVADHV